jgi:hypothetical protein
MHSEKTQESIRRAVVKEVGKEPTEVAVECCDEKGRQSIFIGLPGASYRSFAYNPAPTGKYRLSPDVVAISSRLRDAIFAAVRSCQNLPTLRIAGSPLNYWAMQCSQIPAYGRIGTTAPCWWHN